MGIITMNMCQGNFEHDQAATTGYDDEIMYSGWNPVIATTQPAPEDGRKSFPAELATVDMELFLDKMHG